jgi:hypothetical protein
MSTDPVLRPEGPWLHPFAATESAACDRLRKLQHAVGPRIACRAIRGRKARTRQGVFDEFAAALQFPCYFGENWDAFDECLTDLEWLPAEGYVLLVTHSAHLLEAEAPDQLATLFRILERAGQEWSQSAGSARPPRAFHVLLQCGKEEVASLRAKLDAAKVASSPVWGA